MGYNPPSLTAADVLAAITNDSTKFNGADIDAAISSVAALAMLTIEGKPSVDHIEPTTTPATITLANIVIPNISGYTIEAAYAGVAWTFIGSSSGSTNYLSDGTLEIDKASAGWLTALDNLERYKLQGLNAGGAVAPEGGGGCIMGDVDIKARVAFNATSNFRITTATANGNNLYIWGARPVLWLVVS